MAFLLVRELFVNVNIFTTLKNCLLGIISASERIKRIYRRYFTSDKDKGQSEARVTCDAPDTRTSALCFFSLVSLKKIPFIGLLHFFKFVSASSSSSYS